MDTQADQSLRRRGEGEGGEKVERLRREEGEKEERRRTETKDTRRIATVTGATSGPELEGPAAPVVDVNGTLQVRRGVTRR